MLTWFKDANYERPQDFADRMSLAKRLRELSNNCIKELKIQDAMLFALGSLHCIDFSKGQSTLHSEEQKQEVLKATVPLLSNLSLIFLKRDDSHNCIRAASLGLTFADRLEEKPASLPAKLLYRRGLGKSHAKDFPEALKDFVESARLMPEDREIRRSLEECKAATKEQRDASDDKWRGVMRDKDAKVAKGEAFVDRLRRAPRRYARAIKRRARQALADNAETLLTFSVILLAPLFACAFGFLLRLLRRT